MTYKEKLKDPRWQKKRLEIFNRDNWKCTECGRDHLGLHVHHLKYVANPWESKNEHLQTLCVVCHRIVSRKIDFTAFKDFVRKKYNFKPKTR